MEDKKKKKTYHLKIVTMSSSLYGKLSRIEIKKVTLPIIATETCKERNKLNQNHKRAL